MECEEPPLPVVQPSLCEVTRDAEGSGEFSRQLASRKAADVVFGQNFRPHSSPQSWLHLRAQDLW